MGTESESGETGSGPVASCRKPGPMIPVHRLASGPEVFGQTLTRPSRSDPDLFCAVWSMPSLENGTETDAGSRIRHIRPGRFWLHAGHNGHNWP